MSDNGEGNIPLPSGPWGLHGIGDRIEEKQTHTPPEKKKQNNRRREHQAEESRRINRHK